MSEIHYILTVESTGQVLGTLSLGDRESSLEKATAALAPQAGQCVVAVDSQALTIAQTQLCYWDFDADVMVGVGMEPFEGATFDFVRREWIDGRTLDQAKAAKWAEIKELRARHEAGGFSWNGHTIDSDDASRSKIANYLMIAQITDGFSIDWTTGENKEVTLARAELEQLMLELGRHMNAVHATSRVLRAQVGAARTIEEVGAITWPD